jgi:hypothetical protein
MPAAARQALERGYDVRAAEAGDDELILANAGGGFQYRRP